jgi:hypothetical protein
MDVTAFGKAANALDIPDFAPKWEEMMSGVTEAVPIAKSFPGIVQFMQALPLEVVRFMDPLMGAFFDYNHVVRAQVRSAREQWESSNSKTKTDRKIDMKEDDDAAGQRKTIFNELLDSGLPLHEKSEDRLTQEGVGFISAASETTSLALNTLCYHVFTQPGLCRRLREEVLTVMPDRHSCAKWHQLEQLPLLVATVKEGLRISTAICGRLPLIAPEPLTYRDMTIPANVSDITSLLPHLPALPNLTYNTDISKHVPPGRPSEPFHLPGTQKIQPRPLVNHRPRTTVPDGKSVSTLQQGSAYVSGLQLGLCRYLPQSRVYDCAV